MKRKECAACGVENDLHFHHLQPKSKGGSDEETNLVTLCTICHGLWHNMNWSHTHSQLVAEGIDRARDNGIRLGPKPLSIGAPENYLQKGNQPIEDVIFCLFHIDKMLVTNICNVSWGEITIFKDAYSRTTEQAMDRAIEKHNYQREHFTWPIVMGRRGLIRKPNAVTQKISRMRKRVSTTQIAPFQLPALNPEKALRIEARELRARENHKILKANKKMIEEGEGIPQKLRKLIDLV